MSEENKAVVRRWLEEVLTRGNLDRAEDFFAPNHVLHDPSFPKDVHGPEGVKRCVATYRAAFPDICFAVEDQIAEGSKVVVRGGADRPEERTGASSWGSLPPVRRSR